MKDVELKTAMVVFGIWAAWVLGSIGLFFGVLYVAWHFISKFW